MKPADLRLGRAERREADRRAHGLRQHAGGLFATGDGREANVGGDAIEPAAERRAPLEAAQSTPRADERLLHRVLRVVERAQHPVAVELNLPTVRLGPPPGFPLLCLSYNTV